MFTRFSPCLPVALCGAMAVLLSGCSTDPFAANDAASPSVPVSSVAKTSSPSPIVTKVSHKDAPQTLAAKASCSSEGFCALPVPIRRPNPVSP